MSCQRCDDKPLAHLGSGSNSICPSKPSLVPRQTGAYRLLFVITIKGLVSAFEGELGWATWFQSVRLAVIAGILTSLIMANSQKQGALLL